MKNKRRIHHLINQIYGPAIAGQIVERLNFVIDKYRGQIPDKPSAGLDERDIILIVYPDQVQEPNRAPLQSLREFCEYYLKEVVSGVHLLPFFPSSSDDGFSVIDYREVDSHYGSWNDVKSLSVNFRLMFDAVINHASVESSWFKGFLLNDKDYSDYFIEVGGSPDLSGVVRPRALPLLTTFNTPKGPKEIWTTFSSDQADLNYNNPAVLLEILDILLDYVRKGADFIRLDAVAYLWKEIGTPCINLPQTHSIVQLIRAVLDEAAPTVMLITETNVPHEENISYFGDGTNEAQLVYNFPLPPLVLHTFFTEDAQVLSRWASGLKLPSERTTYFNFLASHDGIGLNPVRGILSDADIENLVRTTKARGGLVSYKTDTSGVQSPYELNINYLDALSISDEPVEITLKRFITAHAILLSIAGMPGVYFHSLFGSRGWPEGVTRTGRNRSVNREKLDRDALRAELESTTSLCAQVFTQFKHLIYVRAQNPAFKPYSEQHVLIVNPEVFTILRIDKDLKKSVLCFHNVSAKSILVNVDLSLLPYKYPIRLLDLISSEQFEVDKLLSFSLAPYQSTWLAN